MNMIEMNMKAIIINLQILNDFKEELIIIENKILQKNKYFFFI